jgi:23S rRNA (guanosine2251-2'-O)-methyltransferase
MSPPGRGKPRSSKPSSKPSSKSTSPKRGSSKPPGRAPRAGPRPYQSRGAGRTGPIRSPDGRSGRDESNPAKKPVKNLGGEQIEGRQAVRELLIAQRRKVHEVWIAADLEGDDSIEGIVALAAANRHLSWLERWQSRGQWNL